MFVITNPQQNIKHDLMLGTPWFETIIIKDLDWHYKSIHFLDKSTNTHHTWRKLLPSSPNKIKIKQVRYDRPQDFLRNTEWCLEVDLTELESTKSRAATGEINEISETKIKIDTSPSEEHTICAEIDALHTSLVDTTRLKKLLKKQLNLLKTRNRPPRNNVDKHRIKLINDPKVPPWRPVPQLSQFELETLKTFVKDNLERGYIKHSSSPYGACVLFAKKKDGSLRVCVDYRGLNNISIKDKTPLPHIKEMQARLQGATIFSKLDLREGFHNILVHPEDTHKTAFRTRFGHFEFQVVPFGL